MSEAPNGFTVYDEITPNEALRALTASALSDDHGQYLIGYIDDVRVRWPLDVAQLFVRTWWGTLAWNPANGLSLITDFDPTQTGAGHIEARIDTCDPQTVAPRPPAHGYSRAQRPFRLVTDQPDLAQGA